MLKGIFIVMIGFFANVSYSQPSAITAETVYKKWQIFPDSKNNVEIFYAIVKCNGVNQINLMIYNDGASDQEIKFTLEIRNVADEQQLAITKNFFAKQKVFHKASCDNVSEKELKIILPNHFNPSDILIKQLF